MQFTIDQQLGRVDADVDLGDPDADILSHDTYTVGVPHAAFARLRAERPVAWIDEPDGRGFWAVTRYEDVLEVSRNTEVFASRYGIRLEDMTEEETEARRTLMEMDAPEHTRFRRLVSKPFTRAGVRRYEESIRQIARDLVNEVRAEGDGTFDFVERIARQLPMRMLSRLLGLPDADGAWLVERGDALIANTDPEFTEYVVDQVDTDAYRFMAFRSPVGLELFDYARREADRRRAAAAAGCPHDDVLARLLEPMTDGAHLTDREFNNFFTLMVAAGNDTTRYTMTEGLAALIARPATLDRLRRDPGLVPSAVEEILRWSSVTMHFRRTAVVDTELGGQRLAAGDKVVIYFVSANKDERQFADPFHFDIARNPTEHTAFGRHSPHLCLGAHLARLEVQVLLEELLPAVVSIEEVGPRERLRSNFISGIKHLPLRVTWA